MKKYIKDIAVALTIGLIFGFIMFAKNTGTEKECTPITVSLNCTAVKGGIQIYYTTDSTQNFIEDQMVSSGEITGDEHVELQLDVKKLHKLRMDIGNAPGVVTLKDITIEGDTTVTITNFNNTVQNDIEEVFWDVDKVYVRSFKENPYLIFQTPFNINAKSDPNRLYISSLTDFILATLIVFLAICIARCILKRKGTDFKHVFIGLLSGISAVFLFGLAFSKKNLKEVIALAIGIACGVGTFVQNSDTEKEVEPITISLNTTTVVGGIQLYYTTDPSQEFSSSQLISSEQILGEKHLEFLLAVKSLHKLRMDFGSHPGVVTLKDITIKGDRTVRITNFNNTKQNDIEEYFWNGEQVYIKSLKADPFIIFETPFDIDAKVSHTRLFIESLVIFLLVTLIAYLAICAVIRITTKKGTDFKRVYTISMFILAGILSSVVAKILSEKVSTYYQKDISISAKLKTENPFNLTFFYTTSPFEQFSPVHMTDVPLKSGENDITVMLPTGHIENLRVDFGSKPGVVEFESLTIHGKEDVVIKGEEFNSSQKNELEEFKISDGKLQIKSSTDDPWLALSRNFNIDGTKVLSIDRVIFFTIFLTLLAFLSFGIKTTSKHVEGKRSEDLALIIVFIAACISPSFFLTDQKVSESEKRNLAEFPIVSDSTGFNSSFSTQFDTWYSEHFAKRDEIVSINNSIFQSKGDAQNTNVIEGKDGWYFYKLDKQIENFANLQCISDEDMVLIKDYLLTVNNWCTAHGKKFYFLICPNKASVYGDKVKHIKKLQGDEHSDAVRTVKYLNANGIKAVYSKDELMKHMNDGYLLYRKQDTHHSEIGAYYSYKAIMDVISKDFPILAATPLKSIPMSNYKDVQSCDLKQMMPGAIRDDTCDYQHLDVTSADISAAGTLVRYSSTNTKGNYGLYLSGDSFSMALQGFFSTNFNLVNACRENQYWFPNEELDKIEATSDIVLLELVERHLILLAHQNVDSKMQPYAPQHMAAIK